MEKDGSLNPQREPVVNAREYLSKLKQYPHLFFFKPTGAPLSLSNLSGTTGGKMSLTAARVMSDQLTSCHVGWGGSSRPRGRRGPRHRSRVKFPTICVGIVESDGT